MKRRDELLVGFTILFALAVVVGGALWLSERQLGQSGQEYVARFNTVGGLSAGSPVVLRGVKVGRVQEIRLAEGDWVEAVLSVDRVIPGSQAVIAASASLFGEWQASIVSRDSPDINDPNVLRDLELAAAQGDDAWPGATLPDIGQLTAQAGRIASDKKWPTDPRVESQLATVRLSALYTTRIYWGQRNEARGNPPAPLFCKSNGYRRLCRETGQCLAHVTLAQPFQRAVAQLANSLSRDAQHSADFLQRMLATAVETEVELQNPGIARGQRGESFLDLITQETVHRGLFRVRQILGDEAFDQRPITVRLQRCVEAHLAGIESRQRLYHLERETSRRGDLLRRRLATKFLAERFGRPDDFGQIGSPVQRDAYRPALTRQRGENRLPNPPYRVRDELDALIRVKFPCRGQESDVALPDEVGQRQPAVLVFLRHRDDKPQVALGELLHRLLVAVPDFLRQCDLLRRLEQGRLAHLKEVLIQQVAVGLVDTAIAGAARRARFLRSVGFLVTFAFLTFSLIAILGIPCTANAGSQPLRFICFLSLSSRPENPYPPLHLTRSHCFEPGTGVA